MSAATAAAGIGLLLQLIEQAARASVVIRKAQEAGRELSLSELELIVSENDQARAALIAAIDRARAEGR